MKRIFSVLPREYDDEGILAVLHPLRDATVKLPRALPLPTKRPTTKWEAFAQSKGIRKEKRNKLQFDKVDQDWKLRYGRKSLKKAEETRNFMIEHKRGTDPMVDPFKEENNRQKLRKAEQKVKVILIESL